MSKTIPIVDVTNVSSLEELYTQSKGKLAEILDDTPKQFVAIIFGEHDKATDTLPIDVVASCEDHVMLAAAETILGLLGMAHFGPEKLNAMPQQMARGMAQAAGLQVLMAHLRAQADAAGAPRRTPAGDAGVH